MPASRASLSLHLDAGANSTMVDTAIPVVITRRDRDRQRPLAPLQRHEALAREVVLAGLAAGSGAAAGRRGAAAAGGWAPAALALPLGPFSRPAIRATRARRRAAAASMPCAERARRGARIVGVADRAHDATRSAPAADDLGHVAGIDAADREERDGRMRGRVPHERRARLGS